MRMLNQRFTYLWAVVLFLLVGCAEDVAQRTQAAVRQDAWTQIRVYRNIDAPRTNAWTAEAWSAEFSGVDARTVREAMNIVEVEDDACIWMPRHRAHAGQSAIRFKAMGAAQITDLDGVTHTLQPRSLALQTDAIHGVIYTTQMDENGHTQWQFDLIHADGSSRVHAELETPQGWGIVAINGDTTFNNPFELDPDEALHLYIDADADATLLVARSTRDDAQAQLVCNIHKERTLELSAELLDTVDPDWDIDLQLILRNDVALQDGAAQFGEASIEFHDRLRLKRVTFDTPSK